MRRSLRLSSDEMWHALAFISGYETLLERSSRGIHRHDGPSRRRPHRYRLVYPSLDLLYVFSIREGHASRGEAMILT